MGYRKALEAAGAKVLAFEEFGSYQGDWLAKVEYQGEVKFIHAYYGSCSGCDAFQAEFGYLEEEKCDDHSWEPDEAWKDCEACKLAAENHKAKLVEFGRGYLGNAEDTYENILKHFQDSSDWDGNASEVITWLEAHKVVVQ